MSKTVKDMIEEKGYGVYNIELIKYEKVDFKKEEEFKYQYKITYTQEGFLTRNPNILNYTSLDLNIKCLKITKESDYECNESKTDKFEVVLEINEDYFRSDEIDVNIRYIWIKYIYMVWNRNANEIEKKHGIYIPVLINESRVIYKDCPIGGKVVYKISGERNPKFTKDSGKYRGAVEDLLELVAKKLKQTTFTISWSEVELGYYEKVVE